MISPYTAGKKLEAAITRDRKARSSADVRAVTVRLDRERTGDLLRKVPGVYRTRIDDNSVRKSGL